MKDTNNFRRSLIKKCLINFINWLYGNFYSSCNIIDLTTWLMKPGGLMPHLQELSNNPYPISSRSILILSSHLRLGLPKGLFPEGLPVKILKALYPPPFWLHALPISIF